MTGGARDYAVLGLIMVAIMAVVGLTSLSRNSGNREYRGAYIVAFEYETFIEGELGDSLPRLDAENVGYLSADDITLPPHPCTKIGDPDGPPSAETFSIRFIGRRERGVAGHFGA